MNTMLEAMLAPYEASTLEQRKHALREIAQEIILCGLSRAGFFGPAAFYGGTALRIFYGLDRFSEDLDFSLRQPNDTFDLRPYLISAKRECEAWGLHFRVDEKRKTHDSAIRSAFLKGSTRACLITLFSDDGVADAIMPGELLRIKLELDTDPAPHATFERQYRLLPSPYEVGLYDTPSLFAGKVHAVIARAWRSRVKGRDLYDYVFYRARKAQVNLAHLEAKLQQTGQLGNGETLNIEGVRQLLRERFKSIDYAQAKADVIPFVTDPGALELWSAEFFCAITEGLEEAPRLL
jgi:predicted nucleotidyltransferase component of viral defense system